MNIHGIGPGARALRAGLTEVEGPDLHWGSGGGDKLRELITFKNSCIPCPQFTTDISNARDWQASGHDVWGRMRNHTKGKDIVPYESLVRCNGRYWSQSDFWVRVIPNITYEFRVLVWQGNVFRVGIKLLEGTPRPGLTISTLPVRNDRTGWELRYSSVKVSRAASPTQLEQLKSLAIRAVSALNYQYGGVDLYLTQDGSCGVFEVNTRPGMGPLTTAEWVRVIRESYER